jgi:hypothetical protein
MDNTRNIEKLSCLDFRSCRATVRVMRGVLSKSVSMRKMRLSAGRKLGGHRFTSLHRVVCGRNAPVEIDGPRPSPVLTRPVAAAMVVHDT